MQNFLIKVNTFLLLIKDDLLLKKHNMMWDKVSKSVQKGFGSNQ